MRQLLAELRQRLLKGLALVVVRPAEHCLGVPDLKEEEVTPGKAVLRAARVIAVIADIVSALVVGLATAPVIRIAVAALRAGVGLKNFVVVEALAVVLIKPPCLAPLAAEAPALRVRAAELAAPGVVRLTKGRNEQLKVLVTAAARNVGLGVALRLAAEEEVGHLRVFQSGLL